MGTHLRHFILALLFPAAGLLPGGNAGAGNAQIRFVNPQEYTDAAMDGAYRTDPRVLSLLERHFQSLAARCLSPGQTLNIQVFDIDLAGQVEWWRRGSGNNVRVMREITWPRITLAYTLHGDDGRAAEAREQVSDMEYLWAGGRMRSESEALPYERAMLERWFAQRFCG